MRPIYKTVRFRAPQMEGTALYGVIELINFNEKHTLVIKTSLLNDRNKHYVSPISGQCRWYMGMLEL